MIEKSELEQTLDRINEWIRAADQKISIFLAFQGVFLALLAPEFIRWTITVLIASSWSFFFMILTLVFLIAAIGKSIEALASRLRGEKESLIYFGDIAKFELQNYKEKLDNMTAINYRDQLIEQIHTVAKISLKKHKDFRVSIALFALGVFTLAISLSIYVKVTGLL